MASVEKRKNKKESGKETDLQKVHCLLIENKNKLRKRLDEKLNKAAEKICLIT